MKMHSTLFYQIAYNELLNLFSENHTLTQSEHKKLMPPVWAFSGHFSVIDQNV